MASKEDRKPNARHRVADGDRDLFRQSMADARPLQKTDKEPLPQSVPAARARFSRQDESAVLKESLAADVDETEAASGESLRFHRASVGRRTLRKLARGNYSVQNEIDLHGMIIPQAKESLHDFIAASCQSGHTCVRIIHGKGLGSGDRGPVLKNKVNRWLRQWDEVLAFVSARQVDGGTGAVYVLLQDI